MLDDYRERYRAKKEENLIAKEGQAVYELTCRLMKENDLTYEQVQEGYK